MYCPEHFTETNPDEIAALIQTHPLATLVSQTDTGLVANALPLLRQGEVLIGHIARANPLHEDVADGADVLAVFHGPDAYVSPNWYPSKAQTHKAVPTWNYQLVQVAGKLRFHHDAATKRRVVHALTHRFEQEVNGTQAWNMGDALQEFLTEKLDAIVALRIEITGITAKSKLSQNRSEADQAGVRDALGPGNDVASAMGRNCPDTTT